MSEEKECLSEDIKRIFEKHKSRYGSRRIQSELKDKGIKAGLYQIRKRMKEQGLVALQAKSYVPITTQTHPHLARSPNLLLDKENLPTAPRQVIVGDITYIPNEELDCGKWLYLATWMDLFSRRIVGWCLDRHMEESLIIRAFYQSIRTLQPTSTIIVHSDGGGQYGGMRFRELLNKHNCKQSMTRRNNHYDNAFAESLFSRFKTELVYAQPQKVFLGFDDAFNQSFEYIDGYYNTIRKHSALGYLSPIQFEEQYWKNQIIGK